MPQGLSRVHDHELPPCDTGTSPDEHEGSPTGFSAQLHPDEPSLLNESPLLQRGTMRDASTQRHRPDPSLCRKSPELHVGSTFSAPHPDVRCFSSNEASDVHW